jgi:hypothetical protein
MNESLPEVQFRLAELKQTGAHAVAAIKTIRDEFHLSLGEAKLQFSRSPTWAPEQAAAEQLLQQVVYAFRAEDAK